MASNSSAAAVAALFGIRDGDHEDQIKPLFAQQQQHHHHQPPMAPSNAAAAASAAGSAAGQAAVAAPPAKKKRTLPGNPCKVYPFFFCSVSDFQSCMHGCQHSILLSPCWSCLDLSVGASFNSFVLACTRRQLATASLSKIHMVFVSILPCLSSDFFSWFWNFWFTCIMSFLEGICMLA